MPDAEEHEPADTRGHTRTRAGSSAAMIVSSIQSLGTMTGARAAGHLDIAFRDMMTGPWSVQDERYLRLVTGQPHPMGNVAVVSRPDDVAAALEATAPLIDCGAPAAAIFPAGATAEVLAAVKAQGFPAEASMPAMAVDIDRMRPTSLPPGYDFARIGAGTEGAEWAEALAVGYEIPRPMAEIFGPANLGADASGDAKIQFFAVRRDGRQVATTQLYLADGLAGIYCVSTRPEERHKGLGAHATAEALRMARHLGYRVGVLQSSTAGHSVYLGLGFGDYASIPMLVRVPG
jgi:GNAT superfamily N-acetyltransferase